MKVVLPIVLLSTLGAVSAASAAEMSKDELVCALDPACQKAKAAPATRGLTVTGQQQAKQPAAVDLYISFGINSSNLSPDGRATLDNLGSALKDKKLENYTFLVGGHTDAKGSPQLNMRLSEKRAAAVRRYLVAKYRIQPTRLAVRGFGSTQLLDPAKPEDPVNRRVQILNTSTATAQQ
jgi:outer membrane protein OmpA-like peptidoglycan-associated protein